jgi:hypothetical protein
MMELDIDVSGSSRWVDAITMVFTAGADRRTTVPTSDDMQRSRATASHLDSFLFAIACWAVRAAAASRSTVTEHVLTFLYSQDLERQVQSQIDGLARLAGLAETSGGHDG